LIGQGLVHGTTYFTSEIYLWIDLSPLENLEYKVISVTDDYLVFRWELRGAACRHRMMWFLSDTTKHTLIYDVVRVSE